MKFACSSCGAEHDLAQLSFGADAPDPWNCLSDAERRDSTLAEEQCIIRADDGRRLRHPGADDTPCDT
ncbi:MAG: DUF2199 domain-containing protein [Planctomycetes bacterium]|nr:DUF2199 domain-containing protein [Planctomycetota bacterium]MBI3844707.1 DUF2199 domain-containing protein [Planctomycetota bacterium]